MTTTAAIATTRPMVDPAIRPRRGGARTAGVGRRLLLASAGAAGAAGAASLVGSAGVPSGAGVAAGLGAGAAAAGVAVQTVKVTIEVNKAALVGQLFSYLNDPHFSINRHPVVEDWTKRLELSGVLLEALRLEGDLTVEEVERFVDGLIGSRSDVIVY